MPENEGWGFSVNPRQKDHYFEKTKPEMILRINATGNFSQKAICGRRVIIFDTPKSLYHDNMGEVCERCRKLAQERI